MEEKKFVFILTHSYDRPDIVAGAMFPDYQLPDQTGTMRRLSELQGIDPMIVVLSRGGF